LLKRCSLIENMDVRYDDEHAIVIVENRVLHFSPTEYKVMRVLLTQKIATREALVKALSLQSMNEAAPEQLTKYVYKVRRKVQAYGIHVSLVHDHGYMLVAAS
jgi:DNA-binding response OmpR family regulator